MNVFYNAGALGIEQKFAIILHVSSAQRKPLKALRPPSRAKFMIFAREGVRTACSNIMRGAVCQGHNRCGASSRGMMAEAPALGGIAFVVAGRG
jgi:hypothetical protein